MATATKHKLIEYFEDAINTLVLSETAKHHAKVAHDTIVDTIAISPSNELYTKPQDLDQNNMDALARQSLDAHLKQVQSSQLEHKSTEHIATLQHEAEAAFTGKKFQFTAVDSPSIDVVFAHSKTGQHQIGKKHPAKITGSIVRVSLVENRIIVRPGWLARKLVPSRIGYIVHVLNEQTLEPSISIT